MVDLSSKLGSSSLCVQSDLTYELFIPLVNGEVPECSGDRTDDPVHLHPEQLDEDRQALLLPHRRPDVDARLPVARGQVLNRAGGRLQRLRVGTVGEQVEVRLHNLDNLVTLCKVKVKSAKEQVCSECPTERIGGSTSGCQSRSIPARLPPLLPRPPDSDVELVFLPWKKKKVGTVGVVELFRTLFLEAPKQPRLSLEGVAAARLSPAGSWVG